MLEIQDLRFRYSRRGPMVLEGVNLTLRAGEIGILLGRNGSGKTFVQKHPRHPDAGERKPPL